MKQYTRMFQFSALMAALLAPVLAVLAGQSSAQPPQPKQTERSFDAPNGMKLIVRMVAPYAAQTDLPIICVFKHNPAGDKYIESMKTFDDKLSGLLSLLRNRGDFVGELGETILFNVPKGTLTPRRVLVIGLGPEKDLSLDTLRVVGRVALREAVRLKAQQVAFAPTIRDQGNSVLDVGDVDNAVIEQVIVAYDTEKRLQAQGLAEPLEIREWVIEAGPAYVDSAIQRVGQAVDEAGRRIKERDRTPYRRSG